MYAPLAIITLRPRALSDSRARRLSSGRTPCELALAHNEAGDTDAGQPGPIDRRKLFRPDESSFITCLDTFLVQKGTHDKGLGIGVTMGLLMIKGPQAPNALIHCSLHHALPGATGSELPS